MSNLILISSLKLDYDQQDEQYNNNNKREVNREFDNEQKNQPDEFKVSCFPSICLLLRIIKSFSRL